MIVNIPNKSLQRITKNAVNRASKVGLSQVNTQGKVLEKVRMFNFIYQATTLDEEDIRKDNATEEEVKQYRQCLEDKATELFDSQKGDEYTPLVSKLNLCNNTM